MQPERSPAVAADIRHGHAADVLCDTGLAQAEQKEKQRMGKSRYLYFRAETPRKGKTVLCVVSKSTRAELGGIAWHPRWRQYVFIPNAETVWSEDCLEDVRQVMLRMETPHA